MYITSLSRLCDYREYSNLIRFRIQVLHIIQVLQTVREAKQYYKILLKHIKNFDYLSFIIDLKAIIQKEELFPLADVFDNGWETIEEAFSYVPYQLVGYYGQYDSYISIDDLDNMTEHERIVAMILCRNDFILNDNSNYDKEKYNEYIQKIKDKYGKNKLIKLVSIIESSNYDVSEIYKGFVGDYINDQYPKNDFTENFYYLFQRIVRDTGCVFIDMCPEEQDTDYSGWDCLESYIEIWREYKHKEKNFFKWIADLDNNKILKDRFYRFLFEEVIPRYL